MWFDMRGERLDFVERAPMVYVAEATLAVPRAQVFAAFAEPRSWPHWFPDVRQASYPSAPPHGVGTIRHAHVGRTYWIEEMIAWDEGTLWAWTVTRASVPFANAQVESFAFTDAANGTRVRWTLALEPRLLARLGAPFTARVTTRLFHRAMRNLEAYVQLAAPEALNARPAFRE